MAWVDALYLPSVLKCWWAQVDLFGKQQWVASVEVLKAVGILLA